MAKRATLLFSSIILIISSINLFAQAPVITKQPHSQGVIVGQKATFSVLSSGTGLTYQWYLNDTPIGGATDSVYTTPTTTLAHNGEQFKVIVSNLSGNDTSNIAYLYVTASGSRVTAGQIALYNFKEGKGNIVHDISGYSPSPVNLTINNPAAVDWSNNGLYVTSGAMIQSAYTTTGSIIDAIRNNNELTIELWIRPLSTNNSRILDLSTSISDVDFGVEGVATKGYNFLVRTTTTDNTGIPGTIDSQGLNTNLIQLIFTRSSDGVTKIYRDGVLTERDSIGGDLHTWAYQATVSLGSFIDGTVPFKGIYYLASLSDRALDSVEVAHNYSVGISGTNSPFIVQEPQTNKVLVGFSGIFQVKAVGSSLTYQWQKNGSNITGATDSVYTTPPAALVDSGDVYRVIVSNSSGSDTSDNAILDVKGVNPECTNGITHYYHLDEASSPYIDTVGFSDATSSTSPASVAGIVGKAADFSNDEKIDIPADNSFNWKSTDSFTLEFWMKTNASPTDVNVALGRDDATTGIQWYAGYDVNGKATFFLRNSNNEFNQVGGGPNINDGKWHLVVAERNAAKNKLYLFVDGNAIDSAAQTYAAGFSGTTSINIGYLDLAPFYYFHGNIDEVAFYNASISKSDIQNHYYKGLKGYGYCSVIPPVAAPTNLQAVKNGTDTTNVDLTWKDNSTNELGFVIQRKLGDSTSVALYSNIDTVAANVTSFVDTTTSDTTKYTYRIYAYNADTVSVYSNAATYTTPMPVELTSFSADVINDKIMISWETATEINNAGFSVERSIDNKKFSEVAYVKGKGTSTEKSVYRFVDKSALSGKYYYRLKQVDFDGTSQYSKSVEVDMGLPTEFSLNQNYPNPFNPSTTIRFALPMNAKVNIRLYNTLGQEVANILNNEFSAGVHETVFNASNLSSGIYFYRLEAKGADGSVYTSTKRMMLLK